MCDKWFVLLLAAVGLAYNAVSPGPDPISAEAIYAGAFAYLTGSAVGFQRGKNGNGAHKPTV